MPTGYKMISYTVGFNSAVQCGGFYRPHLGSFSCYYHNASGAERTGTPFVNVVLAKTNYVDGDLIY